jgi:SAM-dependent methyltransferase
LVKKLKALLSLTEPVSLALDVACGTGSLTVAVKEVARTVIGADLSERMLANAPRQDGIFYLAAAGEALPFPDGTFDLVTIASAYHWLEKDRFLPEARRVLKPEGSLAIVEGGYAQRMLESPEFEGWQQHSRRGRFPSPPRHPHFQPDDAKPYGFPFVREESNAGIVRLTQEEYANHLLTYSGIVTAIESGSADASEIRDWIFRETEPFFPVEADGTRAGHFAFSGRFWLLGSRKL